MLDLLEYFGIEFDNFDSGQSFGLQRKLFPNEKPQSICSLLVAKGQLKLVWIIGKTHCMRSYDRYHGES